jgi:flagellar biosynthesis protein FliQ
VPKILSVLLVVVLSFPWMVKVMTAFTTRMFTEFNTVVRQIQ